MYSIPLLCVNCGNKFIDDEPDFYPDPFTINPPIEVKKGTKIADVKCPVCGCQTLTRWKSR